MSFPSSLFLVWYTVTSSLELHGRHLTREGRWRTVFPSPTLPMYPLYWSCCANSVPLTPCWAAVSLLTMSVQVGEIFQYREDHLCHVFYKLLLCKALMVVLSGSVCDLHFEVLPQSDTSFSVTFQQPNTDTLAVCEHFSYMYKVFYCSKILVKYTVGVWEPLYLSNVN